MIEYIDTSRLAKELKYILEFSIIYHVLYVYVIKKMIHCTLLHKLCFLLKIYFILKLDLFNTYIFNNILAFHHWHFHLAGMY